MSDLAERLAKLSPERRALVEASLGQRGASGDGGGSIPRRRDATPAPLSFAQLRLWFLYRMDPESPLYNLPRALRIRGDLHVAALRQALDRIVARHEALRTTFATADGAPVQVVGDCRPVDLPVIDLRDRTAPERERELRRLLSEAAKQPFDLTRDLMLRACLLRLGDDEYVLSQVVHHIAVDGWSQAIMRRELEALYAATSAGQAADLPDLGIQYADYAAWQREWLTGGVLERALAYWRRALAGAPTLLELPTDRPRPAVQRHHGARHPIALPASLSAALAALSRRENASLFMTLLAGFTALLHRHAGQDDILVAAPIAGRTRMELEPLVGLFANTLALRADLSGDPTFRELLGQVRSVTLEAYSHQDLPFEKLVEELRPARTLSHAPLCQVMFAFQNTPGSALTLPGVTVSPVEVDAGTARFDLTLDLRETAEGLRGTLEYDTDLFEAATITRLIGQFQVLLEGAGADPGRRVSALPLLTEAERRTLLVDWNATRAELGPHGSVHALVEAQVARTPDATAVTFKGQELTYRDLDGRADRLARRLRALGVGAGTLVGLCVERSLDMVVGVLGILKAGGAYVPLDPSHPAERLAFVLADSRASVLVTQTPLRARLPQHEVRTLCLDADEPAGADDRDEARASRVHPDDLAYVIYTSGSTGRPKGVEIPHRAVVNFLEAMRRQPGLRAEDSLLAVTTLSFDIAALELFLPLTVGARLVLAGADVVADGALLAQLLADCGATVMQATPATWRLLLDAGWQGSAGLKVLCGGEALSRELATLLRARSASVWNLYGPTETTIWSTAHPVGPDEDPIPIGKPIANTEVYVLDSRLQPVPVGVPGELYIGGAGLARGYLDRPELTAERFIRHPFSPDASARLYWTGDVARFRPDGALLYLGRRDHQVKLRGHRIELGEIEAVLEQHPAVRQAVAVVWSGSPGDARLTAYVVTGPGEPLTGDALREFLGERLPAYMVPSTFVSIAAVPLTPSGKVDRKALPSPAVAGRLSEPAGEPPRTPTEHRIAEVWRDVLGVPHVSVHDNFFDLGGHSLLSLQVLDRLERETGFKLRPRDLFLQTLGQLAATCDQARPVSPPSGALGHLRRLLAILGLGAGVRRPESPGV